MTDEATIRRTDVGYGRPPQEHQFQKGNTPKRKTPKPQAPELSIPEILSRVLNEERKVSHGGKTVWMRNGEILARKAWDLSELGNPTMGRLLNELIMLGVTPGETQPEVRVTMEMNPDG